MTHRTLDRIPSRPHPRMASFRAERLLTPAMVPRSYSWRCDVTLDQGPDGACVGFGWAHEAAARPAVWPVSYDLAMGWYAYAKDHDYWPGSDYEGTSVDGGAQAARNAGVISSWYWAETVEEILLCLGYKGPVVFGLDWWDGMFDPDADGFIWPTGSVAGGHCVLGNRVRLVWKSGTTAEQRRSPGWVSFLDPKRTWIGIHNSWGPDWGDRGDAKITLEALWTLMAGQGEACVPLARKPRPASRQA